MTVQTTTSKQAAQAMDGVATNFTFTFRALTAAPEGIKVTVLDTTTSIETDLIKDDAGTDGYTVAVDADGIGGSVTVISARSSDFTLTIYREYTLDQLTNLADFNSFPADTLEKTSDKNLMISQQLDEVITRSMVLPITTSGVSTTLPVPSASEVLGWNAGATAIENKLIATSVLPTISSGDSLKEIRVNVGETAYELFADTALAGWTDDGDEVRLTTVGDEVGIGIALPTAKLEINNASGEAQPALEIDQAASAETHLRLTGDPTNGSPTDGDLWYTGSALNFRDGATTKDLLSGGVIQFVSTSDGTPSSGTTNFPTDDSIPQNTEGDEYITVAITPTNASNTLKIEFTGQFTSGTGLFKMALFQDSTANALGMSFGAGSGTQQNMSLTHIMTAGTTSATTFKIRAGADSSTTYFNRIGGNQMGGGTCISILSVTEIAV